MRVNVDSAAVNDPRMHLLARHLGINVFEVMGRILRVWLVCYDRRSAVLQPIEIDIAADRDGFVDSMIASGLATPDEAGVYVRGVTERITFLESQSEKGRKSGEVRRAKSELRTPAQQGFAFGSNRKGTPVEQRLDSGRTNPRTYSLAPDLDQAPDQALDHPPRPGGRDEAQPGAEPQGKAGDPATSAQESAERVGQDEPAGAGSERAERKPAREVPDQAVTLAQLLLDAITANHPSSRIAKAAERTRAEAVMRWAATIDKMHRLDRLEWGTIQGMITWCQRDSFWRGVILGADNLRDKWDHMLAQRNRPRDAHPNAPRGAPSFDQVLDDAARDINAKRKATDKEQPT